MKTSRIFADAKSFLAVNKADIDYYTMMASNRFICFAIDDVLADLHARGLNKENTSKDCASARNIIQERLGKSSETGDFHTVESYLKEIVKAPKKLRTADNIQAYRHRWLDALIAEYQLKGD